MTEPVRIMVADDQAMIRDALATLLQLEPGIDVVEKATDGQDVLDKLAGLERRGESIDVVIVDIEMPRLDGLTTCAALRRRVPQTKVLIVTTFGRPGYVQRALEAGAGGFIVKDSPLPELVHAIEKVYAGEQVIDPKLAVETLTHGRSPLTLREAEVLQVLIGGCTIEDASAQMGISAGTIRNYVSAAMDKTGARTRAEAARIAQGKGWLDP